MIDHIGLVAADTGRSGRVCGRAVAPVAGAAANRSLVDAVHALALAASGRDNGAARQRPHDRPDDHPAFDHPAFDLDPDGRDIDADCRRPR
ncbi:hypothetical protein EDC22_10116 [Tepidamorphus gemmatus]|uniref:Uncharacterized protein n=1 Tax=Tepidamorphus gemmatus TaxID=747076 RepID=A0A4R3MME6_9HYPH|nr:hypothetical protein [Tepidamorphus gemmatus]TCT13156.1 hypothetical protein EDC22_10116 [Tepidamorphus gemmatus]